MTKLDRVLELFSRLPLEDIEIVRWEVQQTGLILAALYHPAFCPEPDQVWAYTARTGTPEGTALVSFINKVRAAKNAIFEKVEGDAPHHTPPPEPDQSG